MLLQLSSFEARLVASRARQPAVGGADLRELSQDDISQFTVRHAKPIVSHEKDGGRFYLGVDYLNAYRQQGAPDFVLLSRASVFCRDCAALDKHGMRAVAQDDHAA